MLLKIVSVAVFAAVMAPIVASAQTVAQIGQPAERPPASFKGAQYVDSRGCVFMNASYAGAAQWVARVSRNHKVLCGYPPTFGAKPAIEVAEDVAPVKVAPVVVAAAPVMVKPAKANAPMATVASAMMPEAVVVKPVPQVRVEHPTGGLVASLPTPAQSYERVAAEPAPGKIGCYTSVPVAEVVRLRNGGTAVVCTRGDGTLTGWRPPIYPRGAGVGAALSEPVQVARADNAGAGRVAAAPRYASAELPDVVVPKGYKVAWTDGRLNPQRGIGTAEGQAAQDQIWNQKVPAQLITDVQKAKVKKHVAATVTVSSKGQAEAAPKAVRGGAWVQIGTFGVAANAAGAAAQLQALGLPVAKAKLHRGGKDLQIVMAGPFGSGDDAQAALRMARGAGFGDAYIR
ncbi:MAG: SPOR domain-containing protein [Pseudomonadota bacterium]